MADIADRLELNRQRTESGCWLWTKSVTSSGYGQISVGGRMRYVHLVAYETYVGPIPEGYQVDHVAARGCTSKLCFNPEHLEPVTQRENMLRSGIHWANFARGTCKRGHDVTDPANVYERPDGRPGRQCRQCIKVRKAERRAGL